MKTFVLAALVLLAPTEPTLLRRVLKTDAVDTYKIEDKIQQTVDSALGSMPMTILSSKTYVLRTTKVDEASGSAKFEATTTVDKLEATGSASEMMGAKPQALVQTGKIDVRGRMALDPLPTTDALASLLNGSQGSVAAGTFVELPEKPAKIGDTWDVVVPKAPYLFDADQHLAATLTGERDVEGVPAWVVSIRGTIRTEIDTAKLPGARGVPTAVGNETVQIKGQIDLTGEGLVDKATGKTLSMTSRGFSRTAIELVNTGITLETKGTIDSTAKLQKPPAQALSSNPFFRPLLTLDPVLARGFGLGGVSRGG